MIVLSVLYPKTPGARFDHDYYATSHMPMVSAHFTAMTKATALRGATTLDGTTPAYEVITLLEFPSVDALQAALAEHGAEVMGDVPKFTDIVPRLQINDVAY